MKMKLVSLTLAILTLAGCTKVSAGPKPLTEHEEKAILSARLLGTSTAQVVNSDPVYQAVLKLPAVQAMQTAQENLAKAQKDPAYLKAVQDAQNIPSVKANNAAIEQMTTTVQQVFSSRGIKQEDWVLCYGGTNPACGGIKEGELALRPAKK
jgi:hypothetical protein